MRFNIYITLILIAVFSLNSFGDIIIKEIPAEEPKKDDSPKVEEKEPLILPEDNRSQVVINVVNQIGKGLYFDNFAFKPAPGVPSSSLQPNLTEYTVRSYIDKSGVIATLHGGHGAQFILSSDGDNKAMLYLIGKDDAGVDTFEPIPCIVPPSMLEKSAAKSISFVVIPEGNSDSVNCWIYYDRKIGET